MRTNVLTALFIVTLVIGLTITSPLATITLHVGVALAQQSATTDKPIVVQNVPKEAVPAALSSATDTPEKFKPLLSKWRYDDPRFLTKFEIKNVENGEAKDIGFTVGGRSVDTNAKISEEKGVVRVKIPIQQGTWELTYYPTFGGMLDGSLRLSSGGTINGKFYREK